MKRTIALTVGVVLMAVTMTLSGGSPAHADQSIAVCTASFANGRVSPISMTHTSGYFDSGPGPLDCIGLVNGHQVTGTGVMQESGPLSGSCAGLSGGGTQTLTIPTTAGIVTITQPFTWRSVGLGGPFEGSRFSGTWEYWPTVGNCLLTPDTRYAQLSQGVLKS